MTYICDVKNTFGIQYTPKSTSYHSYSSSSDFNMTVRLNGRGKKATSASFNLLLQNVSTGTEINHRSLVRIAEYGTGLN
jgi:hypothetical protein